MSKIKLPWLFEDQKLFLERDYLEKNETAEERYEELCQTIEKYCLKLSTTIESIEYSKGISDRFKNYISKGWVSFSTPVLINFGKKDNLPISCNKSILDDSLDSIYSGIHELGMLAKYGAGTSENFSNLRTQGSEISTGGQSNSIIDWIELYADMMSKTNQNRARRGFLTAYLSVDHPEIMSFLDIGTHRMSTEKQRFLQTITTAVTLPIGWLDSLKEGDKEKRKIWGKILKTRKEIGFPYILDLTNTNNSRPQVYKDKNMFINTSNICCVSPDTRILTDKGYKKIGKLLGQAVNVWNGVEFTETTIIQTGKDRELFRVTLDSGEFIDCTENHNFYGQKGYKKGTGNNKFVEFKKPLSELEVGDKLEKFDLPLIEGSEELKYAYTQGFYCGDGTGSDKQGIKSQIRLYGDKKLLVNYLDCRKKKINNGKNTDEDYIVESVYDTLTVFVPEDMELSKTFVPSASYSIKSRLDWLAGLLDSDGTVTENQQGSQTFQIGSVELEFLRETQLMLQTLGIHSTIRKGVPEGERLLPKNDGSGVNSPYYCKQSYRLLVSTVGLYKLKKLGLCTRRLKFSGVKPNRDARYFSKVISVEKLDYLSDTFCFTEKNRGKGMFNGILTGQCETAEYVDSEKTFACCLSSANAYYFDDWSQDPNFIFDMNLMLDCVIEEYIEKGSKMKGLEKAVRFAKEHRSIGLGILGFHSYLQKKSIVFGELASYSINNRIFSLLREESDKASKWMAKHWGEPLILKGYGLRNTTRLAQAPTKSTSYIMGGITLNLSEGIEPHKTNYGSKKLAKIQSEVKNTELLKLLQEKGKDTKEVWDSILKKNGSVQHLDFLDPREKEIFRTFSEISQVDIIKLAGQRSKYIDQGQSINIMIHPDTPPKDINNLHLLAFEEGVKGLYYQYSINASQQFSQDLMTCSSCEA